MQEKVIGMSTEGGDNTMAVEDAPLPPHFECLQLRDEAVLRARKQERELIRAAFLRAWSKDRGDSPQRPGDYHKDTWIKAQAAIENPELFLNEKNPLNTSE